MKCLWMVATVMALVIGASDAHAGYGKSGESDLKLRYFTAEVPRNGKVQLGVKLPLGAKIARTKVFVDAQDRGTRKDWSKCDIEKKTCSIGDVQILGFHRSNEEKWQQLSVDLASTGDQPRYAKITVLYQTQSGADRTGCNRTSARCGFSGPVE